MTVIIVATFYFTGRRKFLLLCHWQYGNPAIVLKKKVKVRITNEDGVYAATCVNSMKIPNLDSESYETFKAITDSIIAQDTFTSM